MTEARDVADTIHRLRNQADALRALYPAQGPIPEHVKARIAEKRRAADALEAGLLERGAGAGRGFRAE